ncbi:MAG: VOC family protein [Candidatus Puniceispirillaceae bacterium]|jgi:hypothetical protein
MRNANSHAVIDHLVFGCDHLQNGTSFLEQTLGVCFSGGGKHTLMATHNRLLKLQDSIYFEAIAIDHEAEQKHGDIGRKRWFSLDEDRTKQRLAQSPRPLTWVVAVDDIYDAASKCGYDAGKITTMTRGDLEWMLTIAEDGTLVEDGLLPGLIQWPGGRNPANKLPESGTRLQRLILQHPQPDTIGQIIDQLGIDGPVEVRPGPENLIFEMQTNAGELVSLSSASV